MKQSEKVYEMMHFWFEKESTASDLMSSMSSQKTSVSLMMTRGRTQIYTDGPRVHEF
ncbi:hypothetical protein PO124_33535 [Bacillus licheniformis]|nr:hypothetical protein [Bacillus licheniformis]